MSDLTDGLPAVDVCDEAETARVPSPAVFRGFAFSTSLRVPASRLSRREAPTIGQMLCSSQKVARA